MILVSPIKMKTITTTNGYTVLVDDEDYKRVAHYNWFYDGKVRCPALGQKPLGDFVLNIITAQMVDHKDRNPLNNQKQNLRLVNYSQNAANSSLKSNNTTGFKGVKYLKHRGTWQARIKKDYVTHHLGTFKTPEEAAAAYDTGARLHFGEFACTNEDLRNG